MRKSRFATVIGVAAAATLLTITQASAWPTENDLATATSGPDNLEDCAPATSGSQACFHMFGDWFSAKDRAKDGYSAVALWRAKDANGSIMRGGNVWNKDGAGTTRWKNKNLPDGYYVDWASCLGDYATKRILEGSCGPMKRIINQ
ncbi:hypothetical protein ACH4E8_21305 [Streptomyces sp. NPDC017979]|uniref:hypothetical protein n=1 Tax=Streptomyces sp. NPDC017979 TaxID=3365024 RepID=UPI00379C2224